MVCPNCETGEMKPVFEEGFEYMRCDCGFEVETPQQMKRNDDFIRQQEREQW